MEELKINMDKYGYKKIILVNKNDELFHQRFVIAHELAHYLFDFLGSSNSENPDIEFTDTYSKDRHETLEEKRADKFAASILMPEELFIDQYNFAQKRYSSRIFITIYLSRFFEVSVNFVDKRIEEVFN